MSEKRAVTRRVRKRSGRPIEISELLIDGIAANAAREGETVTMWQHIATTSDDQSFHSYVEGLDSVLAGATTPARPVRVSTANHALIVIKPDNSARVWIDNLAISMNIMILRDIQKGEEVYERDIGDVRRIRFEGIKFDHNDKVFILYRDAWRFAFYMNTTKSLDLEEMSTTLAKLYRKMRYAHLYDAVADQPLFDRLVSNGWFPFAEIIGGEFKNLLNYARAGWPLDPANEILIRAFDDARMDRLLSRWLVRPHFSAKRALLEEAIDAYKRKRPVSVLKIALTEIEGILGDAYKAENGRRAKLKSLLKFAERATIRKTGAPDSLLLPEAFGSYLSSYTFRDFNPDLDDGSAGSRHAVGHGVAPASSYTQVRALQALLTLDQLALAT